MKKILQAILYFFFPTEREIKGILRADPYEDQTTMFIPQMDTSAFPLGNPTPIMVKGHFARVSISKSKTVVAKLDYQLKDLKRGCKVILKAMIRGKSSTDDNTEYEVIALR